MQEIIKRAETLNTGVNSAIEKLVLSTLETDLEALRAQTSAIGFWDDNLRAQDVMKKISKLENRITPWRELEHFVEEITELAHTDDESLENDLNHQLGEAETKYEGLKSQLKFNGKFDDFDAIIGIHAGAGGTDAQDWAQMLLRMYIRFCEKSDFTVLMIDESAGEEAGLKSVTFEVSGSFAYGRLKGEHGVHRLVRLSPFNADNLRQTSFAKVEIMPKIDKPDVVEIDEKDLKIDVYRSGGKGGQSVNTTDSAVRITHLPTNIVVAIQNERSQLQNRETAMTIIRSKLAQLQQEQHLENLSQLKGPNEQAAWGNQIRSYVLHPYKQVKDLRTRHETSDAEGILDGNLDEFIEAYLEHSLGQA
ncbi:peptide chain release factor 2 [Candidatus Saccharibacteria bacterium]|nr:peptide chain release factor 2 [Candidatus Saccharibacteria bacterium]